MTHAPERHDPYAALRLRDYRLFAGGHLVSSMGLHMLGMALGWEVYERTRDPLALGLVGLARALPVLILALFVGQVLDWFDRRKVLVLTQIAFGIAAVALAVASAARAPMAVIYGLIVLSGCARVFNGPARATLLPLIVPRGRFHNAVTWSSGVFQFSALTGPLLAGLLISGTGVAWPVYACTAVGCLVFAALGTGIRAPGQRLVPPEERRVSISGVLAGVGHLRRERTVLGALVLDLFAVFLGGAAAMMPVYAKEILHVGPIGLGALKAAEYVGALAMSIFLAHRPPFQRAGRAMLWSVAGFGAATIVFGLSTNFWLSLAMLLLFGALDNISVVVRHVLVQVRTPDHLRGRVSAVNSVFIESSNELGAFESGAVARAVGAVHGPVIGAVASVVGGGVGTILVVIGVALSFPELRRLGRLDEHEPVRPAEPRAPGEEPDAAALSGSPGTR